MNRPAFKERYWLHITLFVLTLFSTMWAGAQMAGRFELYAASTVWFNVLGFSITGPHLWDGFLFGGSLLLFLTVHEFGHYFAARIHRVDTSLPYYIPFPFNGIGTFGAVIRIRQPIPSMLKLFDIGAAGPLAGFIVALIVLLVGFFTLPGFDYFAGMPAHEALRSYLDINGAFPIDPPPTDTDTVTLLVGTTPLYWMLSQFFSDVPPMWEMYHYPVLFAGWLGLFFTALNLLPVGQLDGGHILYALVGPKWHSLIARVFVLILLTSGGIGFVHEMQPVFIAWDPGLADLIWPALATILLFYVYRMFEGNFRLIAPTLLVVVILVALGTTNEWVVEEIGYSGWLIWCLLIIVLIKVDHPPVLYREPLTRSRKVLAVVSMIVFILCFSLKPLYIG